MQGNNPYLRPYILPYGSYMFYRKTNKNFHPGTLKRHSFSQLEPAYKFSWIGGQFRISHDPIDLTEIYFVNHNEFTGEPNRILDNNELDEGGGFLRQGFLVIDRPERYIQVQPHDFYNPFDEKYSELYREFIAIDEHKDEPIINFVNKYGILGTSGGYQLDHKDGFLLVSCRLIDFVHHFKEAVRDLRYVVKLYQNLNDRNVDQLRLINIDQINSLCENDAKDILTKHYKNSFDLLKNNNDKSVIDYSVSQLKGYLDANIQGIGLYIDPVSNKENTSFEIKYSCDKLLTAMYAQFAFHVASKTNFIYCKECNNPFPLTRENRELCSDQCSSRRYTRHSRAKAKLRELERAFKAKKIDIKEYENKKRLQEQKLIR